MSVRNLQSDPIRARKAALNTLTLFGTLAYFDFVDWVRGLCMEQIQPKAGESSTIFTGLPEKVARALLPPQFQPTEVSVPVYHEEVFLVRKEVFAQYPSLPSYETLIRDGNLDVFPGQAVQMPRYLFISHKWYKDDEPDSPDGQLLALIRGNNSNVTHVWVDYCCIPQSSGTLEIEESVRNLDRFVMDAVASMTVTFDSDKLLSSGWCYLENAILANKGYILAKEGHVEGKEWIEGVRNLKFTVRSDGPLVLTKVMKHTYSKQMTKQLEQARLTTNATVQSPLYSEFQKVLADTLMSRYRTLAIALVRNMREVYVVGGVPALLSSANDKLVPRTSLENHEMEILQLLMRHPACVTLFSPENGFHFSNWERVTKISTGGILERLLTRANTSMEIGFQEEEETIFSFRRVFPRALNIPPMTQIITEADNNMYLSVEALFGDLLRQTTVDEHTIDDDVDKWTDSPGSPLDVSDYVLFASQHECTSYHVTMQVNALRIYEPKAFAVRRGPLTDLNMRTRPLFSWKHLETSEDAILALRNAEFIRASAVSDEEGEINTFVITNLDEIEPTLAKWEGWALFSLLIEMGSSIKMNLWNCDAETLKKFSPKLHCLYLFTVWISPYHGFKDQIKWAGPILRASFCKVFSDVKLRESILRLCTFGAVFGSLKSHAASRGGVDKMLGEVGDKLLVNIKYLCRRTMNPMVNAHRKKYYKDFILAIKRFLQRETEAREEMARRQAGAQGADAQMLGLLAQLMGAGGARPGMGVRMQQQQQTAVVEEVQ